MGSDLTPRKPVNGGKILEANYVKGKKIYRKGQARKFVARGDPIRDAIKGGIKTEGKAVERLKKRHWI